MPDSTSPSDASSSSANGGEVIAWLNNWAEPEKLRANRVFNGYWEGATEIAAKFNYRLEECRVSAATPLGQVCKSLAERKVKAMLLAPLQVEGVTPEWEDASHWAPFAAVRLGHTARFPAFHIVTPDQAGNTRVAFSKMQECGYRRIGFVASQHAAQHLLFKAGFLLAQLEVDARLRIPPLVLDETSPDQGRSALAKWLERSSPDAILTDMPVVRSLLVANGFRIPQDMGLAACSVARDKEDAGIFENAEEIGRVAVLTVISLMHNQARGIPEIRRQVLIEGHWTDGNTLPRRG